MPARKIVILLMILGAGCFGRAPGEKYRPERIILITLDTLRADHLGCYGYPRETSPFIDSLANKGILFRNAFAPMATTVPSHASLFTSLYPRQVGVLRNSHRLAGSFPTMAELLRERGYRTAALVSTNAHFAAAGLIRGFDYFDRPCFPDNRLSRPANETIEEAVAWLNTIDPGEKFFLWIHLWDPHGPYTPPTAFLEEFSSLPEGTNRSFLDFLLTQKRVDADFFADISTEELGELIDLNFYGNTKGSKEEAILRTINAYDGEVRFADGEIERLYVYCVKKGFNRDALWIITADHGEGLGGHYWMEHDKHLYNEAIRVPLILHSSSLAFPPGSVDRVVQLLDLLPTIAEWIGVEEETTMMEGSSLLPLFAPGGSHLPGSEREERRAFSQRRQYMRPDPDPLMPGSVNFEEGEKYCLTDGRYKLIYRTEGPDEFYDLSDDPYESRNLIGRGIPAEKRLKGELFSLLERLKPMINTEPESVGKDTIRKLKSLGYTQ